MFVSRPSLFLSRGGRMRDLQNLSLFNQSLYTLNPKENFNRFLIILLVLRNVYFQKQKKMIDSPVTFPGKRC